MIASSPGMFRSEAEFPHLSLAQSRVFGRSTFPSFSRPCNFRGLNLAPPTRGRQHRGLSKRPDRREGLQGRTTLLRKEWARDPLLPPRTRAVSSLGGESFPVADRSSFVQRLPIAHAPQDVRLAKSPYVIVKLVSRRKPRDMLQCHLCRCNHVNVLLRRLADTSSPNA
jgi:hypothetical protein